MPSADPRAAEIVAVIADFERSVAAAEDALIVRDWTVLDALLAEQHRLTHALANALEGSRAERPAAFDAEVERRVAGISARRDDQLRRLIAFNHAVGSRLRIIARSREMRRCHTLETPAPRILDSRR